MVGGQFFCDLIAGVSAAYHHDPSRRQRPQSLGTAILDATWTQQGHLFRQRRDRSRSSIAIAAAELLEGRPATTHWPRPASVRVG